MQTCRQSESIVTERKDEGDTMQHAMFLPHRSNSCRARGATALTPCLVGQQQPPQTHLPQQLVLSFVRNDVCVYDRSTAPEREDILCNDVIAPLDLHHISDLDHWVLVGLQDDKSTAGITRQNTKNARKLKPA